MSIGGPLRAAAMIAAAVGAVGSVGLTLYVGRHNPSRILISLFLIWVLSPFVASYAPARFRNGGRFRLERRSMAWRWFSRRALWPSTEMWLSGPPGRRPPSHSLLFRWHRGC